MFRPIMLLLFFSVPFLAGDSVSGTDIYLAGDSTMCNYGPKQAPQQGWGHALPGLCVEGVKVHNKAIGGRSVKSFRNEKRWEKLLEQVREGDYVVIQFGHNDSNKKSEDRYTDHRTTFRELLTLCVREVREKQANPILVSTTARWAYKDEDKSISNGTLGAYAQATVAIAEQENVPLVDLNAIAVKKLVELGREETKKYYMVEQKNDTCHLTEDGAEAYARWFVEDVMKQKLPVAELFK